MRRLLFLPLCVLMAGPASAQSFAPAQARAAEPPPSRASRDGNPVTVSSPAMEARLPLLNSGLPVPVPLGAMSEAEPSLPGVLSARVPTFGAPVNVPPSAVASGVRLYTYTNAQGGLESVAYDPGTGATVVYDQTVSYSLQDRLGQFGQGATPRVGSSSGSGIVDNPSFSLQPGRAIPDSGIPILNQATPSTTYQQNLGLGPNIPTYAPSPMTGTPLGTLGGPSGPVTSPMTGTPLGTLGGPSGPITSPMNGTPLGTLGGGGGGTSFGGGSSIGGNSSLGGGPSFGGGGSSLGGGGSSLGGGSLGGGSSLGGGTLGGSP